MHSVKNLSCVKQRIKRQKNSEAKNTEKFGLISSKTNESQKIEGKNQDFLIETKQCSQYDVEKTQV